MYRRNFEHPVMVNTTTCVLNGNNSSVTRDAPGAGRHWKSRNDWWYLFETARLIRV
jgi:hypothetical protein